LESATRFKKPYLFSAKVLDEVRDEDLPAAKNAASDPDARRAIPAADVRRQGGRPRRLRKPSGRPV